jgi:hypothetical protein
LNLLAIYFVNSLLPWNLDSVGVSEELLRVDAATAGFVGIFIVFLVY